MALDENAVDFEWKITDDKTLDRIFYYCQNNLSEYKSWNAQRWERGVYSKDGRIFLTMTKTINGCMLRTGGDADDWFYTYFLVLIIGENGEEIGGKAQYRERMYKYTCSILDNVECSVSDNIKDYQEIIIKMLKFHQNEKGHSIEYGSEQEKEEHIAKIEQYRSRLAVLIEEAARINDDAIPRRVVFRIPGLLIVTKKGWQESRVSRPNFIKRWFSGKVKRR